MFLSKKQLQIEFCYHSRAMPRRKLKLDTRKGYSHHKYQKLDLGSSDSHIETKSNTDTASEGEETEEFEITSYYKRIDKESQTTRTHCDKEVQTSECWCELIAAWAVEQGEHDFVKNFAESILTGEIDKSKIVFL